MADSTTNRQSNRQGADAARAIAPEQALALVQALHARLDPEPLLGTLCERAAVLIGAAGMTYRHTGRDMNLEVGDGPHRASYGLDYEGENLGELTFRFRRKAGPGQLAAVEELVTLAVPALRNALRHQDVLAAARDAGAGGGTGNQTDAGADPSPAADVPGNVRMLTGRTRRAAPGYSQDDALILVSLDGFNEILERHGDAWAQTLIATIHEQLREGLRDADSVFQIDEGLLAVLLPRTNEEAALDVAAKIRVLIAGLHLKDGSLSMQLTACMGVAGAGSANSPEDVLNHAQQALALARAEGRNAIRIAGAQPRLGNSG